MKRVVSIQPPLPRCTTRRQGRGRPVAAWPCLVPSTGQRCCKMGRHWFRVGSMLKGHRTLPPSCKAPPPVPGKPPPACPPARTHRPRVLQTAKCWSQVATLPSSTTPPPGNGHQHRLCTTAPAPASVPRCLRNGDVLIYGNKFSCYAARFFNPSVGSWTRTIGQCGNSISHGGSPAWQWKSTARGRRDYLAANLFPPPTAGSTTRPPTPGPSPEVFCSLSPTRQRGS